MVRWRANVLWPYQAQVQKGEEAAGAEVWSRWQAGVRAGQGRPSLDLMWDGSA